MATNVPATIWKPTDGNSEMGQSDSANITTLSGLLITTLSGLDLIIAPGTSTLIPATVWIENDGI